MARPEATPITARKVDGGVPGLHPAAEALVSREIPAALIKRQLERYTTTSTQVKDVRGFNPISTKEILQVLPGEQAVAIDLGGKKADAVMVKVGTEGQLELVKRTTPLRSKQGAGYVEFMEGVADEINEGEGIAVGFSFAGPIDEGIIPGAYTRPRVYTNLSAMEPDLANNYDGDLANLFPEAERVDGGLDAETGLIAGTIEAIKKNPKVKKVIYIINGGGIGGAVWTRDQGITADGQTKAAEPGHVTVIDELNLNGQQKPCGQKGSPNPDAVCIEKVGGSGAGIEDIYFQKTGKTKTDSATGGEKPLEGEEIEQLFLKGDRLAADLIDNASILTATAILGLDQATRPENAQNAKFDKDSTIVVCSGGFFRYAGVRERIEKILEEMVEGGAPQMLFADDFSPTKNACADGAAILALTAPQRPIDHYTVSDGSL